MTQAMAADRLSYSAAGAAEFSPIRWALGLTLVCLAPGLLWLMGVDSSMHSAEIDVLEHYGHKPGRFVSAVHVWNKVDKTASKSVFKRTKVEPGSLYSKFNRYGVLVQADWIRVYFNREEVWRTPTPPSHRQPTYILLNLALGPGFRC